MTSTGTALDACYWSGTLSADPRVLDRENLNDRIDGWDWERTSDHQVLLLPKKNLVVSTGIDRSVQRLFGLAGAPAIVDSMGVDNGTSNATAATGTSAAGSTSRYARAFDATPTYSRPTMTALGTYTNATVNFVMKRLYLAAGTADAAGSVQCMTSVFTLDFTAFGAWSQTFSASYTGAGS